MRIALLGSGAREHALAWKIAQSRRCEALYILPGNAGTAQIGQNVAISTDDFEQLATFFEKKQIECVVIGPEQPLVAGISDYMALRAPLKKLQIIGPSADAARLEGSKVLAKHFMRRHAIQTPESASFNRKDLEKALKYLDTQPFPHVLKADGLAAGKGVIISSTLENSKRWVYKMLAERHFGEASNNILIEKYVQGTEISCFVLCEGTQYVLFPEAKDYKKVGTRDTGANTGGMGAVSPVPAVTEELRSRIHRDVIRPTLLGLQKEGIHYSGFLFFGLILLKGTPYVLEYNVRLGDPETQAIMLRIETDLLDLFDNMRKGTLSETNLKISSKTAAVVTLAAKGYPNTYKKGAHMPSIPPEQPQDGFLFHAGTRTEQNKYYTTGGRVLSAAGMGATLPEAMHQAYKVAKKMCWKEGFYREDIGKDLC